MFAIVLAFMCGCFFGAFLLVGAVKRAARENKPFHWSDGCYKVEKIK